MKDRKTIFLFICTFLVIGVLFISEINFHSIATDSGFDASYDSGGGGSSGGGFGSGGSSGSRYNSGDFSFRSMGILLLLFVVGIAICGIFTAIDNFLTKKHLQNRVSFGCSVTLITMFLTIVSLPILMLILFIPSLFLQFLLFVVLIIILIVLFVHFVKIMWKENRDKIKLEKIVAKSKKKSLVLSDDEKDLLQKGYQIYLDVQKAWMNFDYEMLRKLVTDDLFNMYQNQLHTLELKEQQNIMEHFKLKESFLSSMTVEKGVKTVEMVLKVAFFDYIINKDKKVIKGKKSVKIIMTYLLTFVSFEEVIKNCPHCGAKLENDITVCEYCGSNVLSNNSSMRLSKKEVLNQERE